MVRINPVRFTSVDRSTLLYLRIVLSDHLFEKTIVR